MRVRAFCRPPTKKDGEIRSEYADTPLAGRCGNFSGSHCRRVARSLIRATRRKCGFWRAARHDVREICGDAPVGSELDSGPYHFFQPRLRFCRSRVTRRCRHALDSDWSKRSYYFALDMTLISPKFSLLVRKIVIGSRLAYPFSDARRKLSIGRPRPTSKSWRIGEFSQSKNEKGLYKCEKNFTTYLELNVDSYLRLYLCLNLLGKLRRIEPIMLHTSNWLLPSICWKFRLWKWAMWLIKT